MALLGSIVLPGWLLILAAIIAVAWVVASVYGAKESRKAVEGRVPGDAHGALQSIDKGPFCLWHSFPISGTVDTTRGGALPALGLANGVAAGDDETTWYPEGSPLAHAYSALKLGSAQETCVQEYDVGNGPVFLMLSVIRDEAGGNWGLGVDVTDLVLAKQAAERKALHAESRVDTLEHQNGLLRTEAVELRGLKLGTNGVHAET